MQSTNLKEAREELQKNINHRSNIRKIAYENFNKVVTVGSENKDTPIFISFKQLQELPLNEAHKFSDNVEGIKIYESSDRIILTIILIESGKFFKHFHDCLEICEVERGKLYESYRGNALSARIYGVGERAVYDMGEEHELYTKEYTILKVTFIKNI